MSSSAGPPSNDISKTRDVQLCQCAGTPPWGRPHPLYEGAFSSGECSPRVPVALLRPALLWASRDPVHPRTWAAKATVTFDSTVGCLTGATIRGHSLTEFAKLAAESPRTNIEVAATTLTCSRKFFLRRAVDSVRQHKVVAAALCLLP